MKHFIFILVLCSAISTTGCNRCVGNDDANCICTKEYNPVCGCDKKTYSNACNAECADVTYTEGECD